jgi:hypothetical protein
VYVLRRSRAFTAFRRTKGKDKSRFPEGMTERKAKDKCSSKFPSGMTTKIVRGNTRTQADGQFYNWLSACGILQCLNRLAVD